MAQHSVKISPKKFRRVLDSRPDMTQSDLARGIGSSKSAMDKWLDTRKASVGMHTSFAKKLKTMEIDLNDILVTPNANNTTKQK